MTPPIPSTRRNYALTVFVYAGAALCALILVLGPSSDRAARLAMAGIGLLTIIFGIFRPSGSLETDSSTQRTAFDWFVVLIYVAAGIAAIIFAFTASLG